MDFDLKNVVDRAKTLCAPTLNIVVEEKKASSIA